MKHVGPYERFYESFTEAFAYMEEQGYKMAGIRAQAISTVYGTKRTPSSGSR